MELNKTYNENCLDTMSRMPDKFIDLVVTSPPYDGLRKYNGYSFDFESIAKELFRVSKNGGVVVWVVGDATINGSESGTSFRQALFFKDIGFNLHDTKKKKKINPIPLTHNRYEQEFEYMFVFSKSSPNSFNPIKIETKGKIEKIKSRSKKAQKEKSYAVRHRDNPETYINDGTKYSGNIFYYSVGNGEKTNHPAPFPEELAKDHILSWSNENDLIYDPFMGSGTTAKIASLNNRNWIGSEISKEYCDIIEKRIYNALGMFQ